MKYRGCCSALMVIAWFLFSSSVAALQGELSLTGYGPVKENETLWSIAKKFTQESQSATQTMATIFEHNPGAFEGHDINRLKKGSVLKIPQPVSARNIKGSRAFVAEETVVVADQKKIADSPPVGRTEAVEVAVPVMPAVDNITPIVIANSQQTQQPQLDAISAASYSAPATTGTSESPVMPSDRSPDRAPKETIQNRVESQSQPASSHEHDHEPFKIRYSYDVALVNDDNIRRAQWDEDIRDDNILHLTLNAKALFKLSRYTHLSLGASLGAEKFSTFDLLDNAQYALKLKYSFAFSSGFLSPVYAVKLDIGGIESESDIRTSDTAGIGLEMNRWLSDSIIFTLGYNYKKREANSQVFDTEENQLFANIDLELSANSLVYLTYHYITGDIVSSATPRLTIINIAEAIEPDDAFGGVTTNQFAYRLDADSQLFTLGFNSALTRSISYDLSLRFIDSEATQNASIYYDRTIIRAGLLGRF